MIYQPKRVVGNAMSLLAYFWFGIQLFAQTKPAKTAESIDYVSLLALLTVLGLAGFAISRLSNRAQEKTKESGESIIARQVLFGAKDAVFVIDDAGLIDSLNPAAERMFGYPEGKIKGQNIATLIPPPDRRRRRANYIQNPGSHELVGIHQNGDRVAIESSCSEIQGGPRKLFSLIIRDITDTRNKQASIDFQQNLLGEILRNAGILLFVIDREGKIVHFNRACENLTEFSFGEIKNQKLWDIVAAPSDSERMQKEVELWFTGPFPFQQNSTWSARDDAHKKIAWTMTSLNDAYGQVTYLIGAGFLVVSQQISFDPATAQSQKMDAVGRFAGGLAHDFSNLMTAITGYSGLLLGSLDETDPLRKDVEEIKKASDRGTRITRQLLAVSRRQILRPREFDLNEILGDMEMMLRRILGDRIAVEFDLQQPSARIRADQGQIEQAIINIVVNAREAMPKGGSLSIATKIMSLSNGDKTTDPPLSPGSYCGLRITDNGCGMDEQTLSHLFEPFFSTKKTASATGMGLATVYGVVRQSEGAIRVTSLPNEGSSFLLYFPSAEMAEGRKYPEKTVLKIVPTGSETVMIVEGDDRLRATLAKGLARFGYRVLEAVSGSDAQEMSRNWKDKIHLLVADALMPSIGGPDLARSIHMQRPETKVLYITAEPEENVIRYGLSTNNTYLIADTFNSEHFAERVRQVLDTKTMSAGAS